MDKISILNDSRMARIANDAIGAYIGHTKKRLLDSLLSQMRAGPVDPQVSAKLLGGIQALEDLEALIKREILKGEKVEREILSEHF